MNELIQTIRSDKTRNYSCLIDHKMSMSAKFPTISDYIEVAITADDLSALTKSSLSKLTIRELSVQYRSWTCL